MPGFRDIVGHKEAIEHLENAMKLDKISHAYIINGDKGSGKKLLASAFAQVLQCEAKEKDSCGECRSCRQAESGNHPDIIRIVHEKPNSISVDEIRDQLVNDVQIKPYSSRYKIYIVPEAEKLTVQAQNALLKTIEEPPAYAVIMLLTVNASALLPTVLSRCVMLNMKPVSDKQVRQYLMEHVQIPDYQADICSAFSHGNIGRALELATSEKFQEIKSAVLALARDAASMEIQDIIVSVKSMVDFKLFIEDFFDLLAVWYCDVLYFKATKDVDGLAFKDQVQMISDQTSKSSYEGLERILDGIQKAKQRLNANVNFELTMELLFMTIKESLA
ncbi:DNA polymerase III subunit delta' [Lachnospiraceae bacterium 46-15]